MNFNKNSVVVNPTIKRIQIDTLDLDVIVETNETDCSIITYPDCADMMQNNDLLSITQMYDIDQLSCEFGTSHQSVLSKRASVSKNRLTYVSASTPVKVSLCKDQRFHFILKTRNGNVRIQNLSAQYLDVRNMLGNIQASGLDISYLRMENVQGDIIAALGASADQYRHKLIKNATGQTRLVDLEQGIEYTKESIENNVRGIIDLQKQLSVRNLSGNIDISFGAKQKVYKK